MKGTILDFLKLASEKPELAEALVQLASKHDFEFTDEVSDEELEGIAGGLGGLSGVLVPKDQVNVSGVGPTFDGTYYVDEVEHSFGSTEYTQKFKVDRNQTGGS